MKVVGRYMFTTHTQNAAESIRLREIEKHSKGTAPGSEANISRYSFYCACSFLQV